MNTMSDFEVRLKSLQSELTDKLDSIKDSVTKKANTDWSDQAQERENDEVLDALGNEVRRELNLVNSALHRIKTGDYQYCEDCGQSINPSRLNVMPYTQHCIECATKHDK